MIEHKYFIGANNQTGECEIEKVIAIVGSFFAGFTVQESIGVWEGKREKSCVVTLIANEYGQIDSEALVGVLQAKLKQDFVLHTFHNVSTNLVN